MVYENLIKENKEAFLSKVTGIAAKLKVVPDWLMIVFFIECSLDHRKVNPISGATGLIGFMPSTARGLGTSTAALRAMSNVDQLDYVYSYFKPYSGRFNSIEDLYTVTFFPKALGQPDSYILQTDTLKADTIARQNPAYDLNFDKAITYGELKTAIRKRIPSDAVIFLKKKLTPVNLILFSLLVLLIFWISKSIKI